MTTPHPFLDDLRTTVAQAERRAFDARAQAQRLISAHATANGLAIEHIVSDLQTAIHGDVCDALDRIEQGLGMRLFMALHADSDCELRRSLAREARP